MRITKLRMGQCIYAGNSTGAKPVLIGDSFGIFSVIGATVQTKRKEEFIDKFIVVRNVHNDRHTIVSPKRLITLGSLDYSLTYLRRASFKTNCKFTEATAWKAYTEWYENIKCSEEDMKPMSYYSSRYNVSDSTFKKLIDGVSYKSVITGMLSGRLSVSDLSVCKHAKSADVRLLESNNTIYVLKDVAITIATDKGYDIPDEISSMLPYHEPPYEPDVFIEQILIYNQSQINTLIKYLSIISKVNSDGSPINFKKRKDSQVKHMQHRV